MRIRRNIGGSRLNTNFYELNAQCFIRLVQEPRGSLSSPAEFAADGGKFSLFFGEAVQKLRFLNSSTDSRIFFPLLYSG
jgi:hypothetical protein